MAQVGLESNKNLDKSRRRGNMAGIRAKQAEVYEFSNIQNIVHLASTPLPGRTSDFELIKEIEIRFRAFRSTASIKAPLEHSSCFEHDYQANYLSFFQVIVKLYLAPLQKCISPGLLLCWFSASGSCSKIPQSPLYEC